MSKKVSIILPTYNGARYLRDSIRSCLEQSYPNIELVVVDDCSTDETPHILQSYAGDIRVKVIQHAANSKLPAALNTGFAHSSGEYLTWTSDDNLFAPTAIERLVGYLETHPEAAFVYSDYWLMDETGETIRCVTAGPPDHLLERCAIACFLYQREVYLAIGDYDPQLFRIEDYDYWLRVARRFQLAWCPEALYYYRRHSASLTSTDRLENRARMFNELHTRYFGPDPGRRARVLTQFFTAEAFERHLQNDARGVIYYASRAIAQDASLLLNRGVCSILLQAVVGKTVFNVCRRVLRRLPFSGMVWASPEIEAWLSSFIF